METGRPISGSAMSGSQIPGSHVRTCPSPTDMSDATDPFQNNISQLPMELQLNCLDGLITAAETRHKQPDAKPTDFDQWIVRNMGEGIADLFMRPYNFKVWGVPPSQVSRTMRSQEPTDIQMQCQWLGERVAAPSLRTVVRNAVTKEPAPNWGPNATFRFPTHGGTGGIWTAVADMLPAKTMRMGEKAIVKSVDPAKKLVHFSTGKTVKYEHLVSTMALDGLLDRLDAPKETVDPLKEAAKGLVFSSTIVLGVGIRGVRPDRIGDKCMLPLSGCSSTDVRLAIFPRRQHSFLPSNDLLKLLRFQHSSAIHEIAHSASSIISDGFRDLSSGRTILEYHVRSMSVRAATSQPGNAFGRNHQRSGRYRAIEARG